MIKWCPKCEDSISRVFANAFCDLHQKEYDHWLNQEYTPQPCKCGNNEWVDGTLQLTNMTIEPLMGVYRCTKCNVVRLMKAQDGMIRIMPRVDIRK